MFLLNITDLATHFYTYRKYLMENFIWPVCGITREDEIHSMLGCPFVGRLKMKCIKHKHFRNSSSDMYYFCLQIVSYMHKIVYFSLLYTPGQRKNKIINEKDCYWLSCTQQLITMCCYHKELLSRAPCQGKGKVPINQVIKMMMIVAGAAAGEEQRNRKAMHPFTSKAKQKRCHSLKTSTFFF